MTDEIVLPSVGLPSLITWMLKSTISGVLDLELLLFSNTLDPDCDVEFGDLTECTFDGYSRVTLNRSNWQTPVVTGCCVQMLYGTAPISWTNEGSAQQIAGYAYLYPSGSLLVAVQALSTPFDLPTFGVLPFRPQFTLTGGVCPVIP